MVIEINNAKIVQQKTVIIDDVQFSLNDNEFIYLIGKTGSGKSSLLKLW
jgi:cell division transport system ATP-binding protein